MKTKRLHITSRIILLILSFALILPSVVKFSHALSDHSHDVCLEKNQSHLHNIDIDCEFYKFKINITSTFTKINYDLNDASENVQASFEYYSFLKSHQQLTSFLRGPPEQV